MLDGNIFDGEILESPIEVDGFHGQSGIDAHFGREDRDDNVLIPFGEGGFAGKRGILWDDTFVIILETMDETEGSEDRDVFIRRSAEFKRFGEQGVAVPIDEVVTFFARVFFWAFDGLAFFHFLGEKEGLPIIEADGINRRQMLRANRRGGFLA